MNLIEKILAAHSTAEKVAPGDIIDVDIDARIARDFGGANVVMNILDHGLGVDDASKTYFTFDCNPGGSDQKYAANQHYCRLFARENGIKVYDVDSGIGTHLAIDEGLTGPGGTLVSTDSHANILGAIGAFGQGMGDQDIAAVWAKGKAWFKVPPSGKITFTGERPSGISAKDIALNLLSKYGANKLLGYSVELYGDAIDELSLDERVTIASMATEMGAIILLFTPTERTLDELYERSGIRWKGLQANPGAKYDFKDKIDISKFKPMVALPGHPHDNTGIEAVLNTKIDSGFIGSCTNGRMEDLRAAAAILKNRKVAPGVVLKIVPSTDQIWQQAMREGLIRIFKESGALVANAGCAGCAAGQIGQNGPGEITISTGNRNFAGKQGKGAVYLSSPAVVAASAIAGYITTPDEIPDVPATFKAKGIAQSKPTLKTESAAKPTSAEGRVWYISKDDIDTDMIFHNRYLTITDISQMGQYTFDNLAGYEDFAKNVQKGDIVVTTKNFGAGSSRQQAVDCFISLGVCCIVAESFGAIYERNAINAALPILTYDAGRLDSVGLATGHKIRLDFATGLLENLTTGQSTKINPFYKVQMEIFQNGGLL